MRNSLNIFKYKISIVVLQILFTVLLFQLIKLNHIYNLSAGYFSDVPLKSILYSMFVGLKYDMYVVGVFLMPIQFVFLLPFNSIRYIKVFFIISIVDIVFLLLAAYSDTVFFQNFHNHVTVEIFTAFAHIPFLFKFILHEYFIAGLLFIVLFTGLIYFGIKFIDKTVSKIDNFQLNKKYYFTAMFLYVLFTFIFIRGNLNPYDRPIRSLDANLGINYPKSSDIALNGVFTIFEAVRNLQKDRVLYIGEKESKQYQSNYTVTVNERIINENYPYLKNRVNFANILNSGGGNRRLILLY